MILDKDDRVEVNREVKVASIEPRTFFVASMQMKACMRLVDYFLDPIALQWIKYCCKMAIQLRCCKIWRCEAVGFPAVEAYLVLSLDEEDMQGVEQFVFVRKPRSLPEKRSYRVVIGGRPGS